MQRSQLRQQIVQNREQRRCDCAAGEHLNLEVHPARSPAMIYLFRCEPVRIRTGARRRRSAQTQAAMPDALETARRRLT